jgi:competence protein ComEA
VLLTIAAFASGLWFLVAPEGGPGTELTIPTPGASEASAPSADEAGRININAATAEELADALPGIGPVLSERIVAYREENGPFSRTDQLMSVDGIGPVTYDRVRERVSVGK